MEQVRKSMSGKTTFGSTRRKYNVITKSFLKIRIKTNLVRFIISADRPDHVVA